MSFVIDCSVTMAWCFEDERTPASDALLARVVESGAVAPAIWPLEVCNVLLGAARRKRIPAEAVSQVAQRIAALPIAVDTEGVALTRSNALQLAERHGLSSYDASYLELAQRKALPLATMDDALRRSAIAAGVAVL
ncbi:type II toxin-antitoxin system VapC family toxin [Casimicrobium huifangae]|uniref:type II toxin-antitoxin system VapC family toxin n=1 Tax=Casimicrobium huifangae TaxID=2591109 RepID=UPI0037830680